MPIGAPLHKVHYINDNRWIPFCGLRKLHSNMVAFWEYVTCKRCLQKRKTGKVGGRFASPPTDRTKVAPRDGGVGDTF